VRELLAAFNRVAGRPVQVREAPRRPGDVAGAYARTARAARLLGWRPRYDLAEGIRHSLQWAAVRDQILGAPPSPPGGPAAPGAPSPLSGPAASGVPSPLSGPAASGAPSPSGGPAAPGGRVSPDGR
jgi:hypothetical protein